MADQTTSPEVTPDTVRVLVRLFKVAERECKRAGLSLPQYRALLAVSGRSRRAAELADNAVVSRPAVSVLMGALEEQGLLRREPVEDGDRRGVHVAITKPGREILARAEERMATVLGDILGNSVSVPKLVKELAQLEDALDADVEQDVRGRAHGDKSRSPSSGSGAGAGAGGAR